MFSPGRFLEISAMGRHRFVIGLKPEDFIATQQAYLKLEPKKLQLNSLR
jgi:hypothetical protein